MTQELLDDRIYWDIAFYRWALVFYIKDPFSQLQGNDIDG